MLSGHMHSVLNIEVWLLRRYWGSWPAQGANSGAVAKIQSDHLPVVPSIDFKWCNFLQCHGCTPGSPKAPQPVQAIRRRPADPSPELALQARRFCLMLADPKQQQQGGVWLLRHK